MFQAKVLTNHTSKLINETVKQSISEKNFLLSDKSTSYFDIDDCLQIHITEKSNKKTTTETLRWVDIAISNAKRNFRGNYPPLPREFFRVVFIIRNIERYKHYLLILFLLHNQMRYYIYSILV